MGDLVSSAVASSPNVDDAFAAAALGRDIEEKKSCLKQEQTQSRDLRRKDAYTTENMSYFVWSMFHGKASMHYTLVGYDA